MDLDLPSVHKGGYLYRLEKVGELDGMSIPQIHYWSNPDIKERDREKEAFFHLYTAPVGAVYTLEFLEEYSGDETVQSHRIEKYEKVDDNMWCQISVVND